jgi:hypothetical protein
MPHGARFSVTEAGSEIMNAAQCLFKSEVVRTGSARAQILGRKS